MAADAGVTVEVYRVEWAQPKGLLEASDAVQSLVPIAVEPTEPVPPQLQFGSMLTARESSSQPY